MVILTSVLLLDLKPVSSIPCEPQLVQNDISPISRRPQYRSHHHSMQLDFFDPCLDKRQPPALGPANAEEMAGLRRLPNTPSLGDNRCPYSADDVGYCG